MEYLSVRDMSEKWDIKERKLTAFCRGNRIAGAKKIGKEWMIPSDAIKPLDKRTKEFENYKLEVEEEYISKYPKMKEKYSAHICNTADGIKL